MTGSCHIYDDIIKIGSGTSLPIKFFTGGKTYGKAIYLSELRYAHDLGVPVRKER